MKYQVTFLICLFSIGFNLRAQDDKIRLIRQLYNSIEESVNEDVFFKHKLILETLVTGIGSKTTNIQFIKVGI